MRELKFRAWWKDTKRFLDGDEWYMTCSGAKHLHYAVYPYNDNDFVIEQYTGLKDQNGKEIYDGDIVTLCGEWEDIENDDCQVITFSDGCFRVGDDYENEAGSYLQDWRVIGNIHENPELLKGTGE